MPPLFVLPEPNSEIYVEQYCKIMVLIVPKSWYIGEQDKHHVSHLRNSRTKYIPLLPGQNTPIDSGAHSVTIHD